MPLEDSIWSRVPEQKAAKNNSTAKKSPGLESSIWAQESTSKKTRAPRDNGTERSKKPSNQERPKRQDKHPKRESVHPRRRSSANDNGTKINPLAARLGLVQIDDSSDGSDSEEVSRPSTSDRNKIFDKRPSRSRRTSSTKGSSAKTDHAKANKMDVLKRKIEEQKQIQEKNHHKAQQTSLLNDFLNNDTAFDWDDEIK
ncbi:LAFE_0E05380g1_1 [Lachancea fermentati]|uniref:LAFE_0E05380g1_1 n=1 Tax=Lachancea fermentati TaxID=4955 RepID=A0A1G4MCU6_LACFM|nr:LAFE_0E05380g1_1 [Lachancea fermentati]